MSADDRIEELLELAVLGELTAEQEIELDAALADDADLAADLDADLSVAASLQALHAEAPPERLKADLMAAIDALDSEAIDESDASVSAPTETGDSTTGGVVDFTAARSERTTRREAKQRAGWQPLAAAAAVVLLAVGGLFVSIRGGGGDDGPSFAAITEAADSRERVLEGDLGGELEVVFSPSQQAFVLVGTDIPALADTETYQLWLVDDAGAQPVGLFRPDDGGRVEQVFEDLDPTDFVVGVTIEPAAGSDSPTLPIIASA